MSIKISEITFSYVCSVMWRTVEDIRTEIRATEGLYIPEVPGSYKEK